MTEVVVTTGAIRRAKLQSNCHRQHTNVQLLQAWCPFYRLTNSVKALKYNWKLLTRGNRYIAAVMSAFTIFMLFSSTTDTPKSNHVNKTGMISWWYEQNPLRDQQEVDCRGGTSIRGQTRGAGRPSPGCNQEPLVIQVSTQGWKIPQQDLVVHCLCMCRGDAVFGGLLGASRSVECEVSSILFYPIGFFWACYSCTGIVVVNREFFLHFSYMVSCVLCRLCGLLVSTCQAFG